MNKNLIAHELGHAVCAEVQDGFWYPSGISFEKDDGGLAYCFFDKHTKRKQHIKGTYSKIKEMSDLGGIFGEILFAGYWSPWGGRLDVDEFVTANANSKNELMIELDQWLWVDDDDLSFRSCSKLENTKIRRSFTLDVHDTCRRLPELWDAYLDFCDRIDKEIFLAYVETIFKSKEKTIEEDELNEIIGEIVV